MDLPWSSDSNTNLALVVEIKLWTVVPETDSMQSAEPEKDADISKKEVTNQGPSNMTVGSSKSPSPNPQSQPIVPL